PGDVRLQRFGDIAGPFQREQTVLDVGGKLAFGHRRQLAALVLRGGIVRVLARDGIPIAACSDLRARLGSARLRTVVTMRSDRYRDIREHALFGKLVLVDVDRVDLARLLLESRLVGIEGLCRLSGEMAKLGIRERLVRIDGTPVLRATTGLVD